MLLKNIKVHIIKEKSPEILLGNQRLVSKMIYLNMKQGRLHPQ